MAEGHVIVIGGAEDKVRKRVILSRFIALAGGPDARIAVISSASSLGPLAGEMYRQLFTELGAAAVVPIHATTRAQANDDHGARLTQRRDRHLPDRRQPASAVLDDRRHEPRPGDRLERHRQGTVVAGTSAGASALSSHMVAFGAAAARPSSAWSRWPPAWASCRASSSTSTSSSATGSAGCSRSSPRTRRCSGSASTRTPRAWSGPTMVMEVIGRRSVTIVDGAASETDAWEVTGAPARS